MANGPVDQPVAWRDLPIVRDAARALLANFAAWQELPARLEQAGHQAMVVENAAAQSGNASVLAAMAIVTGAIGDLQQTFYETSPKIGRLVHALSQEGGGATLDVIGSAVDAWATMQAALAGMDAQEAEIRSDAPKVLTPQEVASLQIGAAPLPRPGGVGTYVLFGILGIAAIGLLRVRRRRW